MLVIRLKRVGKKHQPSYRLVVSERRSKLGGPPVEDLGSYSPFTKKPSFTKERVIHWMSLGAKPTVTVHNLLVKEGIVSGPKINPVRSSRKSLNPMFAVEKQTFIPPAETDGHSASNGIKISMKKAEPKPEVPKNEVPVEEKATEAVVVAEPPAEPAASNA